PLDRGVRRLRRRHARQVRVPGEDRHRMKPARASPPAGLMFALFALAWYVPGSWAPSGGPFAQEFAGHPAVATDVGDHCAADRGAPGSAASLSAASFCAVVSASASNTLTSTVTPVPSQF